jgi:hypothetical protein
MNPEAPGFRAYSQKRIIKGHLEAANSNSGYFTQVLDNFYDFLQVYAKITIFRIGTMLLVFV